jgi:hypothetical protein
MHGISHRCRLILQSRAVLIASLLVGLSGCLVFVVLHKGTNSFPHNHSIIPSTLPEVQIGHPHLGESDRSNRSVKGPGEQTSDEPADKLVDDPDRLLQRVHSQIAELELGRVRLLHEFRSSASSKVVLCLPAPSVEQREAIYALITAIAGKVSRDAASGFKSAAYRVADEYFAFPAKYKIIDLATNNETRLTQYTVTDTDEMDALRYDAAGTLEFANPSAIGGVTQGSWHHKSAARYHHLFRIAEE